jgi:hypothetical protein
MTEAATARRLRRLADLHRCNDRRDSKLRARCDGHLESSCNDFGIVCHCHSGFSAGDCDDARVLAASKDQGSRERHRLSVSVRTAMLVVAGLLKVSTMLLLLAAALALVALGRLYRDKLIALATVVCIIASAVAYKLVSVAAQNQGIVPLRTCDTTRTLRGGRTSFWLTCSSAGFTSICVSARKA